MQAALDFLSVIFIYLAAALLIITLARHFKGMKIPPFWVFFLGGFFLLSVENFFALSLDNELFNSFVVFIANLLVLLGVIDLYRTMKK